MEAVPNSLGTSSIALLKRYRIYPGTHAPRSFVKYSVRKLILHVDARYHSLAPIGCGSYGIVCSAIDSVAFSLSH